MNKLTTDPEFRDATAGEGLVIAVFKTTWCKDCHYINPFMPDLEKKYEGNVRFFEIDRDDLPDLCSELNILGIPSFIAFKNGKEVIRFVSKLRKTREEIEEFVDRAIEVGNALS
ncbi:thioredoxin family protein [Paenibacillus sp. GSMTC-2017]|uniref:thioredoxin family protein n=1 Tax=Paenibacillus sp. GSMTC-2017 TaxID=2794350 RepID=UPI0018D7194B|nr:thioredoxin family protein [Paenibacillus sp. GSMTC-2017]MBH5319205.1 thioredoxin family protein [Paenibacillus sp. GSMTC-2017]